MIEELFVSNIRLFEGPEEWHIPFSSFTVFCGTNSAGKSTILKTLLLLCQTHSEVELASSPGRLLLTGALADFGTYQSVVSHNKMDEDIVIGLTMRDSMEFRNLAPLVRNAEDATSDSTYPPADTDIDYSLSVRFVCGSRGQGGDEPKRAQSAASIKRDARVQQCFLKSATYTFKTEFGIGLSWGVVFDKEAGHYNLILSSNYFEAVKGFGFMQVAPEPEGKHVVIEAFLRGFLPMGLWAQPKPQKGKKQEGDKGWTFFPLPTLINECIRNLELEFSGIHYIGPLRSPARRYYMTNLDLDPKMDPAGEFLPYVLRDLRDRDVSYVQPKSTKVLRKQLKYVLDSWMCYLRTGHYSEADAEHDLHEFDVASMKDVLLEFKVKTFGGEVHALADSGFGYSQILPIVVRGLISSIGSTIIIEQPELHLNPAIQVRLAEFLVSLVRSGKRIFIETHSEHIVNSIRVLSAEDDTDELSRNCRIVYLNTESGKPELKRLEIQPSGTIPEWPRQFFGEALSLSTRLLRAQDKKKSKAEVE